MNGTEASPFLWQLWIIPGVAALFLGVGAAFVPRVWVRRIMIAVALAVLVPAPIFSPDGGAIVPLGMFLCSLESLGLGLVAVGIATALLFPIVWFVGWLSKGIRRDVKGIVQP
ncbi:MAG: hypothetical protein A2283_23995 [Lentisphaerae bacterium RIFOXYA12_FULL_48_11]|nr:MAG: hypothetical protein A2283_23995 [Lentisphaerae bacterium RIFOXYA12_FULL_48_11]